MCAAPFAKKIFRSPLRFSLRTQLLIVMLSMMILFTGSLAYLQEVAEEKVLNLIQEEVNGLTQAMEISVEHISSKGATDEARLRDYITQLRKRGIEEVSILNKQQEVLLSSNPGMVGSRLSVSRNEFLIRAKIGEDETNEPRKVYSAFVPIISKGKLEGYVHISMYFGDLEKLSREMFFRRLFWTLPVFGLGVILCIFISYRYTKPIPALVDAIHSISQGKMPTLPMVPQADMKGLADSLKDMIQRLDEQKATEEKLKRAEQQTIMAQLASGIAHEIRNPLNFINLSIDHLGALSSSGSAGSREQTTDLIRKTKAEIRRVDAMVGNFLDLGRELVLHPIRLRIDLPVEEALGLNRQLLGDRRISVKKQYADPLPEVEIDIDKMKSCFQNLITNAADSMPNGGQLHISIAEDSGVVQIAFEDTGVGIQPDDLPKVFEPYFTTKKTGTGLGLAITKRIAEAHGGAIDIVSTPSGGTRMTISIPTGSR